MAGIIGGACGRLPRRGAGREPGQPEGAGRDGSGRTSDVIAAIDWAIDNQEQYGLRVINLSLGRPVFESYLDDPLCQAVERACRAGIVVVASAGNYGKLPDGRRSWAAITSPGNSPYALTVGALDTRGTVGRVRRPGGGLELARADAT